MEQLHHIIVEIQSNAILFCGDRGTQKRVQFHIEEEFIMALNYCQNRIRPSDIYYI